MESARLVDFIGVHMKVRKYVKVLSKRLKLKWKTHERDLSVEKNMQKM
jgi:hypothetical protein